MLNVRGWTQVGHRQRQVAEDLKPLVRSAPCWLLQAHDTKAWRRVGNERGRPSRDGLFVRSNGSHRSFVRAGRVLVRCIADLVTLHILLPIVRLVTAVILDVRRGRIVVLGALVVNGLIGRSA